MILPLIRELTQTCRPPKLNKPQKEGVYGLMRRLREYGFTNKELSILVRGKISEASIKRNTRGVEVRETTEHGQIIEALSDFADRGYEVKDIDGYKESRAVLNEVGLNFKDMSKLASNLMYLGVDALKLINFSEELRRNDLKPKAIRENINLNDELKERGISVEIQVNIRDAARKYGDPASILKAVNVAGELKELIQESIRLEEEVAQRRAEENRARLEKERLEVESLGYKTHLEIVKLLIKDYYFDYSSLNELLSLARKHGNPLQVMTAVNKYASLKEMEGKITEAETRLEGLDKNIKTKAAELKEVETRISRANQLLGEIRANYAQSLRLQVVSDLIMNPKEVKAPVEELARITLSVLMGVKSYTDYYKHDSDRLTEKVGRQINWTIDALQNYLR